MKVREQWETRMLWDVEITQVEDDEDEDEAIVEKTEYTVQINNRFELLSL